MAELHILGELTGASGVDAAGLSCRWKFVTDTSASDSEYWLQLEGEAQGVTQMALISSADELAVWGHPLDVHYSFTALRGWPKLHVELWRQDTFGRAEVCGYGFCHVPTAPGAFDVDIVLWRPSASLVSGATARWTGGLPRLEQPEMLLYPGDRSDTSATTGGTISVHFDLIHLRLAERGVCTNAAQAAARVLA